MTRQIAIRLDDDLVSFVDRVVERGDASSRAAVIARLIERERRRALAARDAAILARAAADPDLDSLAEYTAALPLPD